MYSVWCDYGIEGWRPHDFGSFTEAIEFLLRGGYGCQTYRITRDVELSEVQIAESNVCPSCGKELPPGHACSTCLTKALK